MGSRRRIFTRPVGERRYKKLFLIAAEGTKTEPLYFQLLNSQHATIRVSCIKGSHDSSPPKVLKRMKNELEKEKVRPGDEAWLVVDKDLWTDSQLEELLAWSNTSDAFGFALSNPNFEYWLLLHFDEGNSISTGRQCTERLVRRLPDYDKGFDVRKISKEMITDAIRRAEERDRPPCDDWPRRTGTTVYRLVQRILEADEEK